MNAADWPAAEGMTSIFLELCEAHHRLVMRWDKRMMLNVEPLNLLVRQNL